MMTAISVTLILMLMFLSLFLPTGGRFEFFRTIDHFLSLVDRAISHSVRLKTSLLHLFNKRLSMSSSSSGLQSILISPTIAEQIFPEPAFFSSKLGTLPPYTALDPERKREVSYWKMKLYGATTNLCRSDGMMF